MPKNSDIPYTHVHTGRKKAKWAYTVEYWESRQEYHLVKYDRTELIRSLLLWWQLYHHPAFYNVKWRIEL